jgi:hypothetical protein
MITTTTATTAMPSVRVSMVSPSVGINWRPYSVSLAISPDSPRRTFSRLGCFRLDAVVSATALRTLAWDESGRCERELDALLLADAKQHAGGSEGRF